jgi:hypothetical protein
MIRVLSLHTIPADYYRLNKNMSNIGRNVMAYPASPGSNPDTALTCVWGDLHYEDMTPIAQLNLN